MQGAEVTGLSKIKKPGSGMTGDRVGSAGDETAYRAKVKKPGSDNSMAGASRDTNEQPASGKTVGKFATRLKRPPGLFTPPVGTPGAEKLKSGRVK